VLMTVPAGPGVFGGRCAAEFSMTRATGRILIVCIAIGALMFVVAALTGQHYYGLTFPICVRRGFALPYCEGWLIKAAFESAAIVILAIGFEVYNERRAL